MPLSALGILLIAALLHAGWNLLLKRAREKYVVVWWGLALGSVCFLPVLLLRLPIPPAIWPYALLSALVEAAYYAALTAAYQKEDFSLVYPVARGGAPALLALWSILFLKETPSPAGKVGLAVLTLGLMTVAGGSLLPAQRRGWRGFPIRRIGSLTGLCLAALVALIISVYSAIDGAAVKRVDPVAYTALVFVLTSVFALPPILHRFGWAAVRAGGRAHWRLAGSIGCLSLLSYMLVLVTYTFAPVSYAGAIREVSIVFGALAGWLWLKESFGPVRVLGALIIFAGILTILIAG